MVITIKKFITPNKANNENVLSDNNLPVISRELPLNISENKVITCIAKNIVDNVENEL